MNKTYAFPLRTQNVSLITHVINVLEENKRYKIKMVKLKEIII